MAELRLKPVKAFTIYSSDDDRRSSEKGIYKDYAIASKKAKGCGWYGSDGEVRTKDGIFEDEQGGLYNVKFIGNFTDVAEKEREETLASIKSKLTEQELAFLKITK